MGVVAWLLENPAVNGIYNLGTGALQGVEAGGQGDHPAEATRAAADTAPFSALVFKVMSDPVVGSLSFGRIYSGTLAAGATVLNPVRGERERIGRMLQMQANAREDVRQAHAGDIVAFVGLYLAGSLLGLKPLSIGLLT